MKTTTKTLFIGAIIALLTTFSGYQDALLMRWFGIDLIALNYPFWQARHNFYVHYVPWVTSYIVLILSMVVSVFTLRRHFKQSGGNLNWAWVAVIPVVNFIAIGIWMVMDTQKQQSGQQSEQARATLYLLGAIGLWYWVGYYFFWLAMKS